MITIILQTGVKLRVFGKHLSLDLVHSKFSLKTGKVSLVIVPLSSHLTASTKSNRREISLELPTKVGPDIPTRTNLKSTEYSETNSFLKFTHTSISKDLGQTTVPFIDSQNVTSEIATPLQGVGLYWRGVKGFGGFVALKIITIDHKTNIGLNQSVEDNTV